MARKNLYQDDGADELSLDYESMPPPSRTRTRGKDHSKEQKSMSLASNASSSNPNSAKKTATRSSSRTASPSPQSLPASNTSRKRAAANTKKPAAKRGKPTPKLKLNPPKRVREDIFNEPDRLLGPKRSPLYKENIIPAILKDQLAQQILATTEIGYRFGDIGYTDLSQACATFQNDGAEGRHDEAWLAAAWEAHHERAGGRFDEMQEEKFREQWGTESGEEYSDSEDEGEKSDVKAVVGQESNKLEIEGFKSMEGDIDTVACRKVENSQVEANVDSEEATRLEVNAAVHLEEVKATDSKEAEKFEVDVPLDLEEVDQVHGVREIKDQIVSITKEEMKVVEKVVVVREVDAEKATDDTQEKIASRNKVR